MRRRALLCRDQCAGGSKGPGDEGGDRATATLNTHGTAVPCYDGGVIRSHPLPSGGSREVNLHRLATSGYLSDLSDLSDLPTSVPPLLPLAAILFGTRFDSGGSSFSLDLARYLRSRYMFLTYCQFCSEMRNGRQERSD